MKKLTLLTAAALATALVAAPAFAYDNLFTNDTAAITAPGGLQVSASLGYLNASEFFDNDSEAQDLADDSTYLTIPLKASYGVMENLSVFAVLPIISIDDGTDSESGIGDIWLGAKYGILQDNLLTIRGALDLPTGDDEKAIGIEGGFGVDVAAMSVYQMGQIGLNGQVGIRWNAEDDDEFAPGMGIYVDAEGSYSFTEAVSGMVGVEFLSRGDGEVGSVDVDGYNFVELNVGAGYALGEKIGLRGDFIYTVAGKKYFKDLGFLLRASYNVF